MKSIGGSTCQVRRDLWKNVSSRSWKFSLMSLRKLLCAASVVDEILNVVTNSGEVNEKENKRHGRRKKDRHTIVN